MPPELAEGSLAGLRVLVVEDNYVQARSVAECLAEAGAAVVGLAASISAATAYVETSEIDIVVIDIYLSDGTSFDLARHLTNVGVPFLFVTGDDCESLPSDLQGKACLEKPYSEGQLIAAVAARAASRF